MGAWGAALFQDDVACDVRDCYLDLLKSGMSDAQALKEILREMREERTDYDDGPIFWLALAVTQWELGWLAPTVKNKAIKLIISGVALKNWAERAIEQSSVKQRSTALSRVLAKLKSHQPARKTDQSR